MRIANAVFALVFLLGLAVQYNDPDPLLWMAMYGAAAAVCILAATRKPHRTFALGTGIVALLWALFLVPRVLGQVELGSLFREAGMATLEIEEAREALGLFIIAAWMFATWVVARPQKR